MAISSKVLIAIVESGETKEHRCKIYEFPNGVILVPGETTNDWYFDSRKEYNPGGSPDSRWYFEETNETEDWDAECLSDSIAGYESEFCVSASSKVKELQRFPII